MIRAALAVVAALMLSCSTHAQYTGLGTVSQDLNNVVAESRLPLRTEGRFIVDKDGARVKLACVNWLVSFDPRSKMLDQDRTLLYLRFARNLST